MSDVTQSGSCGQAAQFTRSLQHTTGSTCRIVSAAAHVTAEVAALMFGHGGTLTSHTQHTTYKATLLIQSNAKNKPSFFSERPEAGAADCYKQ